VPRIHKREFKVNESYNEDGSACEEMPDREGGADRKVREGQPTVAKDDGRHANECQSTLTEPMDWRWEGLR
jgi:hypothetical protein